MTINDHWGYHADDDNHKSTRTLIHKLVRSAACGGNYLLNVGPTAEGEILPVHVQRLRAMGRWLAANGESVYGTRKGIIPATADVVSTRRGDVHYLHVLNYVSDEVPVAGVPPTAQATLLRDGAPVRLKPAGEGVRLVLPEETRDPFDTVVVVRM